MSVLSDLGDYIAAQVVSLTVGTNLFLGRMPDEPDTCVALIQYQGEAPMSVMGGDAMPPLEMPRVQVMTRAAGYATAQALASEIWVAVEAILNETLSSTRYQRASALDSPFPLRRDSADRVIFVQNFRVVRET